MRRGRPLGAVAERVRATLLAEPASARRISELLQLSRLRARLEVHKLASKQVVQQVGCEWPRPARGRPAGLYGAPVAEAQPAPRGGELHFVMGMMVRGGCR